MVKVVIISKNEEYKKYLSEFDFLWSDVFYDELFDFRPDIFIVDDEIENSEEILMALGAKNSPKNFDIIYLINKDYKNEIPFGIKIMTKPLNARVLLSEIHLAFENKNKIKALTAENTELKKNLYQIDAFYNASSKFAGTLDKNKLLEVLFETMERILSFDISTALIKDNLDENKLKFFAYSLKKITPDTKDNLLNMLFEAAQKLELNGLKSTKNEIEEIIKIKPSYKNEFFDTLFLNSDTLFAPIVIKDKFEGIIQIFRKTPFTKEDSTFFQSIIHQVLAPLRSVVYIDELVGTNLKLQKLERIKSEFVSIVSHELRTPLQPINNALSIILSEQAGKIGEVNKNFANIAKRNVARLSGIIEDLLDLSRMQTGKFDFKFKKARIEPSLELAYSTFKNQAQLKNIALELNIEENLPDVYIDSHRIDQIISNLITNAMKFTNEGGKITISASSVQKADVDNLILPVLKNYDGKYVQISVQDTGIGIEQEDIPKIFDKFSQIENTLSRNTGGVGLGLTISKYFIDAHLGGITVNSKKNEGSKFNVIIPFYDDIKAFDIELNLKKRNDKETGYIEIKEPLGLNFYINLKRNNIVILTKNSKEINYESEGFLINKVVIPNIEKGAFDFMVSKVEEEISNCEKKYDILLEKAFYKNEVN